jgi:hypothetical protein
MNTLLLATSQGLRKEVQIRIVLGGFASFVLFLEGALRVLRHSRPLADGACVPTISLFDPPTYDVASLSGAMASFGETRLREVRTSTAAAPQGTGQDV